MRTPKTPDFWVLEDTSGYVERGSRGAGAPISLRLHSIRHGVPTFVAETTYSPKGQGRRQNFRTELALALLKRAGATSGTVVAGVRLASSPGLLSALRAHNIDAVFAVPPAAEANDRLLDTQQRPVFEKLKTANWRVGKIKAPGSRAQYWVADLGDVSFGGCRGLRCFALSQGGIRDYRRQLALGVASLSRPRSVDVLATLLGWSRWIRFVDRRSRKDEARVKDLDRPDHQLSIFADLRSDAGPKLRLTRAMANRAGLFETPRYLAAVQTMPVDALVEPRSMGRFSGQQTLNVVDLFAGAGGMGLGFLLANRKDKGFRLLFSGELHPIYATTLRMNRDYMIRHGLAREDLVVEEAVPLDLREPASMERVQSIAREWRGVDVLVGGPPCQGFSNANRNSWSSSNPNNRLVDTFFDYVFRLRPKIFVMENVQGILSTQRHNGAYFTVAAHVERRAAAAGYQLHPKLLDSAWFGVPQKRSRFFLIGLHRDLRYRPDAFGKWGPFPHPTHGPSGRPYVTLREAIADLPPIANGDDGDELPYEEPKGSLPEFLAFVRQGAPSGVVWDHVVSTHAEYVIERYRRIPPGSNWSAIADMMTNYAAIERTHSNIYRRLIWNEPSITVSHYRKAMLIHPDQHRGLSLREAARLQSFPDWFRFAGTNQGPRKGMTYKQQQIANAVCPLVAKALAERLLEL